MLSLENITVYEDKPIGHSIAEYLLGILNELNSWKWKLSQTAMVKGQAYLAVYSNMQNDLGIVAYIGNELVINASKTSSEWHTGMYSPYFYTSKVELGNHHSVQMHFRKILQLFLDIGWMSNSRTMAGGDKLFRHTKICNTGSRH